MFLESAEFSRGDRELNQAIHLRALTSDSSLPSEAVPEPPGAGPPAGEQLFRHESVGSSYVQTTATLMLLLTLSPLSALDGDVLSCRGSGPVTHKASS